MLAETIKISGVTARAYVGQKHSFSVNYVAFRRSVDNFSHQTKLEFVLNQLLIAKTSRASGSSLLNAFFEYGKSILKAQSIKNTASATLP